MSLTYKRKQDLYDVMINQIKAKNFVHQWNFVCGSDIPLGNYEISKIIELIETQFYLVFSCNNIINLKFNPN